MHLPASTIRKVLLLVVITVISAAIVAVQFARVPQRLEIGRSVVTVNMRDAGGLYPHSNVTYRGVVVGTVESVETTNTGARARLSIDSDVTIPANVEASVAGMSAVGEMYIGLTPIGPTTGRLADGAVIPAARVQAPVDAGDTLDAVDHMISAVPSDRLQTVIDESFLALRDSGPQLRALVNSVNEILREARNTLGPTTTLIDQLGGLLQTQVVTADAIRTWAGSLARVTGTASQVDGSLRKVIEDAGPAADEATRTFEGLQPVMPMLLANMVTVEQVLAVYNPALEQLLILVPPLVAASQGAGLTNADDPGQNTFFASQLNSPPPCIEGFLPPSQRRSPLDVSPAPAPTDLYCKVDPADPRSIRGARNLPCLEYPGYRAATVTLCRQLAGGAAQSTPHAAPSAPPAPSAPAAPRTPVKITQYSSQGKYLGNDGRMYHVAGLTGIDGQTRSFTTTLSAMLVPK